MKRLILIFLSAAVCLPLSATESNSSLTFFGQVAKVDGHNVMHVLKDNTVLFASLAFLHTPVRGEPFFEETNAYLKKTLENQWVMFTVVRYGRNANVKPTLVRLKDQTSLNAEVVRKGMGMVDLATSPPVALIDQAITASDSKVGMWGLDKKLDPLDRHTMVSKAQDFKSFLSDENTTGIKPYVMIDNQKIALPVVCAFKVEYDKIALTAHSATNKGYTILETCDLPTKTN